jgi:hypothetical protein
MKDTFRLIAFALACVAGILAQEPLVNESDLPHPPLIPYAANEPRLALAAKAAPQMLRETPAQIAARKRLASALILSPEVFESVQENSRTGAQFVGRAPGLNVTLGGDGITVRPTQNNSARTEPDDGRPAALKIRVRGSLPFIWHGEDKAAGESNYFVGNDPKKWRTHVARYRRVEAASQGMGLAVYSAGRQTEGFEYDVLVSPGTDASKLRLDLTGARDQKIGARGDLAMRVGGHEVRMNAPAIYEEVSAAGPITASSTRIRKKATSGTHKKATSATRKRASTSTHTTPRGAKREVAPRTSWGSGSNSEKRRLRKSMHDDPHAPRKKRRKTIPPLPPGDEDPPPKTPRAKQSSSGSSQQIRKRIDGGYVVEADGSVGFWIGRHDANAALVIDPTISISLSYETFLGGSGTDAVTSVATDSNGNVYLGGTTTSASSFPEGANAVNGNTRGPVQLFIAKVAFSANGTGALQYLSFFGGSATQAGGQVAVDPSGNAAILGTTTSMDYPVTDNRLPTQGITGGAGNDVAISEVDPTGANLIFSTLFGGSGTESQNAPSGIALGASQKIPAAEGGIAFDASGDLYVASDTTSQDLPTTTGAYQTAFGGKGASDGFLAKFQPQGVVSGTSDLLYCSYLGTQANGEIAVGGVAVDTAATPNVYIAGLTTNSIYAFPVQYPVQTAYGGGASDAFLMEISPAAGGSTDLVYATLLGGSGMDEALGVAVDTQTPANAYVVGATQSPSFPETPVLAGPNPAIHKTGTGEPAPQNAFLAVVAWNPATQVSTLQYFTYLGGSIQDAAQSVDAPFSNSVYVGGTATSYDFGWLNNLQAFNGEFDAFVAKLDTTQASASSLFYATPLGGTFFTPGVPVASFGNGVAADGKGHVYVAGATTAANFPTAATSASEIDGFQQICGSCQESPPLADAFLAAVDEQSLGEPAVSFNLPGVNFGAEGVQVGTQAVPLPFAILNTGHAPLNLSVTSPPIVAGANGNDFSVTLSGQSGCPQPLQPSQSCLAEVTFTPSTAGVESGVIEITDDAPGSPQLLELTAVGTGPLTASPAAFAFASTPVDPAAPQVLTVTVTAGSTITGLAVSASGAGLAQFLRAPTPSACTGGLAAAASCTVSYEFAPTATGTYSAQVEISGLQNGASFSESVPMTGTALLAAPVAIVRPSQLAFGNEVVGDATAAQPVLVANTGSEPLALTQAIALAGANASDFLASSDCPVTLAPATSCTALVKFSPQTPGAKFASLIVTDNASGSPQSVALTGTAISAAAAQVTPTAWGFASQSVGTQSPAEVVTIANSGSEPLSFTGGASSIAISGANPTDFAEATNCNPQVAIPPGASCTVQVIFAPLAAGNLTATLAIADSAPNSPQTVALNGTGVAESVVPQPTSLAFGSQQAGTSSLAKTVSLSSSISGQSFHVSAISLPACGSSPAASQDFCESDNCQGVSAGASCAVQVMFTPVCNSLPAARTGMLTITDNGANSPQTIPLTGTASGDFCYAPTAGGLSETITAGQSVTFPSFSVYSVNSASPFSGTVTLACASVPAGPTCSLSPGASATISLNVPARFSVEATTPSTLAATPAKPRLSPSAGKWLMLFATAIAFLAFLLASRFRQLAPRRFALAGSVLAGCLVAALCAGMAACGNSATATTDPPPTQTYTLTVTATDTNAAQSPLTINLQLTVNPAPASD